jgi:molybdopterin molybdotransferase
MTDNLYQTTSTGCDDHDAVALSVAEARQRILDAINPLEKTAAELLPLRQALNRVLADDILSGMDVPPHNNSAMDGYAVNSSDLPSKYDICVLRVIGSSFAGHPFSGVCQSGECIQIMTGAVVPEGLDTVIPFELIESLDAETIRIGSRTRPGENVRLVGEDICAGHLILRRGARLKAADLGLLASIGIAQVAVMRALRVAILSTGDELRDFGESLLPGQVYDSNRHTLCALLDNLDCQVTDLGIVNDDPFALRTVLSVACGYDVIISSGGVSVGEADYVREVLSGLGNIDFWKVAMKPGKPLTFGKLGEALFFGLPGNPVSVMVNFCQFVHPALKRLAGDFGTPPLTLTATSSSVLQKRPGRTEFQRGVMSSAPDGTLSVYKTGNQSSGVLTSMSDANCFIVLPAEQTRVEPGDSVLIQPFSNWL